MNILIGTLSDIVEITLYVLIFNGSFFSYVF